MYLHEFIRKMNSIELALSEKEKKELSLSFIEDYLSHFKIYPRKNNHVVCDNPLLDIVYNYHVSDMGLLSVYFYKSFVGEDTKYWYFGNTPDDDLVIDKQTNEVLHKEFGTDHILHRCAENPYKFLDAIYCMAQHLAVYGAIIENSDEVCRTTDECALLAGGDQYRDYYALFLCCWEKPQ